ncbi:T9SS type A sorting domain-containing protein [Aestuariivivens sediminicola]|uniref:T9SS type A sorting domain-containing protein n=1 Tax=Aestuariivivens sediminicola TaxID=2913560 RepID=UPI001F5AC331|nr:T9SS type A sorting domain-containing protein [Aestuariivivens sediminicola]
MKKVLCFLMLLFICISPAFAQKGGDLIESFGSGGMVLSPDEKTIHYKVLVQSDGKILVLRSRVKINSNGPDEIIRYHIDGSRDNDFAFNGYIDFVGTIDDFAIQPDDKIVVLQRDKIFRFNADGKSDTGFGNEQSNPSNSIKLELFPFNNLRFNTISLGLDGKITVAGISYFDSEPFLVFSRINQDGSLDYGLSGTGFRLVTGIGEFPKVLKCELDNNSRTLISVENYTILNFNYKSTLYRFKNNGSLDTNFNGTGKVVSENKIASFASNKNNGAIAYVLHPRANPAPLIMDDLKILDASGNSLASLDINRRSDDYLIRWVKNITIQDDGRIVVSGEERTLEDPDEYWWMIRYAPDGSIDNSFGQNGLVKTTYVVGRHFLNDMTFHNGNIYATGHVNIDNYGNFGLTGVYSGAGIYVGCPSSQTLSTDTDNCFATAGNLDPVVIPANSNIKLRYEISRYQVIDEGIGSASGKQFGKGASTVKYYYSDGTEKSCSFSINVEDNVAPIAKGKDITIALDGSGIARLTPEEIDNGSTDNCLISNYKISKSIFNCYFIGPNKLTLTVIDDNENSSTTEVTVTVEDITPPEAKCKNVTIELDATGNATLMASQVDDGSVDACGIKSYNLSKSSFNCTNVGENEVILTVTDNSDNEATCTATVTVVDKLPPIASSKNTSIQLDATGSAMITASQIDNGSSDNCGIKSLEVDKTSFGCADVGPNTVILTVTDENDNVSTITSTVTVEDNISPVINNLIANPDVLSPINLKMVDVSIEYSLQDNCPGTTSEITSVDVVDDGIGGGVSTTSPDWEIVDAYNVRLRAEKPFNGNGRSYFVTVECTDASGNKSQKIVEIKVESNTRAPKGNTNDEIAVKQIKSKKPTKTENVFAMDQFEVQLYPNPSDSNFMIKVNSKNEIKEVEMYVFDGTGRLVENIKTTNRSILSLGDYYQSGIYFLYVVQGPQQKEFKLIKF